MFYSCSWLTTNNIELHYPHNRPECVASEEEEETMLTGSIPQEEAREILVFDEGAIGDMIEQIRLEQLLRCVEQFADRGAMQRV